MSSRKESGAGGSFRVRYVLALPSCPGFAPVALPQFAEATAGQKVVSATSRASPWPNSDISIVPWVKNVWWSPAQSSQVTLTKDAFVIERTPPGMGVRTREVRLSGEIGPMTIPMNDLTEFARAVAAAPMHNRDANFPVGPYATDPIAYRLLVHLYSLVERALESPDKILHLYAMEEGLYYLVEPVRLTLGRTPPNKTGMSYDLMLRTVGRVAKPPTVMVVKAMTETPPEVSDVAKDLMDASEWLLQKCQEIRAKVNEFLDKVKNIIRGVKRFVNNIMDAVDELTAIAGDILDTVNMVLRTPLELYKRIMASWSRMKAVALRAKSLFYGFMVKQKMGFSDVQEDGTFGPDAASSVASASALASTISALTDQSNGIAMKAWVYASRNVAPSNYYPVRKGDSLESIALAVLGDPTRWTELRDLNNLRYPYLSEDGLNGTMKYGSKMTIPVDAAGISNSLVVMKYGFVGAIADEEVLLFGRDWKQDSKGDIAPAVGSYGDDGLDFAFVQGIGCLVQSLDNRLHTVKGTNLIHPTRGLSLAIGRKMTEANVASYAVDVWSELLADDRVSRITDFQLNDGGNSIGFGATVIARNSREMNVVGGVA